MAKEVTTSATYHGMVQIPSHANLNMVPVQKAERLSRNKFLNVPTTTINNNMQNTI